MKQETSPNSTGNATGMEYNTSLSVMTIAEYGRSVHRMIEYCLTLTDRDEQSRCARSIVRVMVILNPQMKEYADYEHKLWDHLHIISNFQLDVDGPYPKPEPELIKSKPEIVPYPQSNIRFKHYGKILEDLLKKALAEEDPKAREIFTEQLAQLMKRHYLNWNRDSVNDQLIVEQLENLSEGKLKLNENFKFLHTSEILPKNAIPQNQMQHTAKKKTNNNMHKKKKR
ncbi:MAG: DUF4290 domain-containing protein [Bacteroidota bacterium]|nr:DUF4290 domain-containing protein [Bacteroidota bacterium]